MQPSIEKHHVDVSAGTVAYVDVGEAIEGTLVFVHGNPASSAEFVPAIDQLKGRYRCVAIDHIGFGDSDKPVAWDYLPKSHAANLAVVLDSLELENVTLIVGDWGGPIGLSWALDNPQLIDRVIITNSWLWPVNRSLYYQGFSKAMGGIFGRYLIRNHNLFAEQVVKKAWGKATPLTPALHRAFTDVHPIKDERKGMWVFPAEIIGSTSWLATLWERREVLSAFEMTLLWGMQDIAFRPDVLETWIQEFPDAHVVRLADVGHFVALEATNELVAAVKNQT